MPQTSLNGRKIISSIQRALDIIDLFDNEHVELGNAEIAKALGLPVGTASGIIYTLKVNNYLDQNPSNRKYRLGLKLAERAAVLLDQIDLRKTASPYLEEIREWCGESVNLAMRDSGEVVYIERLFGKHSLGIRSELGKRGPVHSTALGKAILSFLPTQELEGLLKNYKFFPVTPHTIINKKEFEKDLVDIHQRGYAIDEEENELGGRCIAAPIFNHEGYPVAALSVSVPIQRFPLERVSEYGAKIKEAADKISKNIGYREPSKRLTP
ncbi:MAG: IclR family transcriptional regulator [Anaerolineae bacterium]|nr:IclR family transcriptional regulator [Anaerolineae bacterium]